MPKGGSIARPAPRPYASAAPRSRPTVPRLESLGHERLPADWLTSGMRCTQVCDVSIVVRHPNDLPDHTAELRETNENPLHGPHPRAPTDAAREPIGATGAAVNGISVDTAGFVPRTI